MCLLDGSLLLMSLLMEESFGARGGVSLRDFLMGG
jgi:hypothetical protein